MARGRMLGNNISKSERVADLSSTECKLYYTWSLAHTDDLRLVPSSIRWHLITVAPYEGFSKEQIVGFITEYLASGLYIEVTYHEKTYYYIPDPRGINAMRKDRFPDTLLPLEKIEGDPKETWSKAEKIIEKMLCDNQKENCNESVTTGIPVVNNRYEEVKLREEKVSEEKNGDFASPEIKKSETPKNILGVDADTILGRKKGNSGISKSWQDKAFRFAEYLGISLSNAQLKSRWLKFFRDNQSTKVESTVSYLSDYQPYHALTEDEAKIKYFFAVYYGRI